MVDFFYAKKLICKEQNKVDLYNDIISELL